MKSTIASIGLAALVAASIHGASVADARTMKHESKGRNWIVSDDTPEDRFAYVLVSEGGESHSGSGDGDDYERVRDLGRRFGGDFLYVRQGDERWVIRDRAVLAQVEEFMEPQDLLGRQQGLLGRQQGRMGREQGRLGREQGELGRRQARLGVRQAELSIEMQRRVARGLSTGDLERQIDALGREQSVLGERQAELGQDQARLGEEQARLGERQAQLGEQQARISREIARKIEQLVGDAAIRRLAIPIG